jgi:hypothetical protein
VTLCFLMSVTISSISFSLARVGAHVWVPTARVTGTRVIDIIVLDWNYSKRFPVRWL